MKTGLSYGMVFLKEDSSFFSVLEFPISFVFDELIDFNFHYEV